MLCPGIRDREKSKPGLRVWGQSINSKLPKLFKREVIIVRTVQSQELMKQVTPWFLVGDEGMRAPYIPFQGFHGVLIPSFPTIDQPDEAFGV